MFIDKCGCGREVRYILFRDGVEIGSCNKYSRCLSYDELYNLAQRRKELIVELLEAFEDIRVYRPNTSRHDKAIETYSKIELLRQEVKL